MSDSVINIKISAIFATCQKGSEEVGPRASKRGPKGSSLVLWRFLQSIEMAAKLADGQITLPSDSIRERSGPEKSTALFDFGRECLKIAIKKGAVAVGAATLTGSERTAAEKMLSQFDSYTTENRKSKGALLSRWRAARAEAR